LIVDEVFHDYPLAGALEEPPPLQSPPCLVARLGGLSKTVGLPQLKLGWIALDGPPDLVAEALDRLELIADTYLSVSTPVQVAAPTLLREGAAVRAAILDRVRGNLATLARLAASSRSVTLLPADGGWSAVLRVPATRSEEDLAVELLERDGVAVHPGYFFDFPYEAFLVISLLPEPAPFAAGVERILERADAA
jgi:aspartate/methionine/tyrosine aminotransferase